jgi:ketosteroid isomerase-like protein
MRAITAALVALVLVAVLLFIRSGPTPPAGMTEAEIGQVQEEVTAVAEQFMAALNRLDPGVAAAIYDPNSMHGNDGATYYATYDEWVTHNQEFFGGFEEMDGEWKNIRIDALAPDVALFAGQSEANVTQVGGAHTKVEGVITLVFRKIEGTWKVILQASTGRWTPIEEG